MIRFLFSTPFLLDLVFCNSNIDNGSKTQYVSSIPLSCTMNFQNECSSNSNIHIHNSDNTQSTVQLLPHSFSIDNLPFPLHNDITTFFNDDELNYNDHEVVSSQLCISSFGMDVPALKYLLHDIGVPANLISVKYGGRNAFHCLALIYTMTDVQPQSQLFAMLRGSESWLSSHMNPTLPVKQSSVLAREIMDSLTNSILDVAKWLHSAGVSMSLQDSTGHTPLHLATIGGELYLVAFLLEHGVDPNICNHDGRIPLHYAVAYGHVEIAAILVQYGSDKYIRDTHNVSAQDIMSRPGPIRAIDAMNYFNITQHEVKQIDRKLHPELIPNDTYLGWMGGTGGWSTERLEGFEEDMQCDDVDQYWSHEITGEEIFTKYLARNTPVLIRGLLNEWDAMFEYERDILREDHGYRNVTVSSIPYSDKYGGEGGVEMLLSEYIDHMSACSGDSSRHRLLGGGCEYPWYIFRPYSIPIESEQYDSLVRYELCPTPESIDIAFSMLTQHSSSGDDSIKRSHNLPHSDRGVESREMKFINAQWALGSKGTGAPIHFHNAAWNALLYGAKKWIMYPPHNAILSNKHILDYYRTDMHTYSDKHSITPLTCVQTAGDVLIIPEAWAHGVLNLQDSVAVASEAKESLFRIPSQASLFAKFPAF